MGPIFGILFWLVLLGIFAAVGFVFLALFVFGWWKKIRWLKWVAGIPLAIWALCAAGPVVLFVVALYQTNSPPYVFESEFGFEPPPQVTELKGYGSSFFDSATAYLRFKAPPDVIDKIAKNRMHEGTFEQTQTLGGSQPDWWTPPNHGKTRIFIAEKWKDRFFTENAVLIYDLETQIAYFRWYGID